MSSSKKAIKRALPTAKRALETARDAGRKVAQKTAAAAPAKRPRAAAKAAAKTPSKASLGKLASRPKRPPASAKKSAASKSSAARASTAKADGERADPKLVAERLARAIPRAECELRFQTPFELLIATILSAQSTDKMVNSVMPALLARYPDARALAAASESELEPIIKSTGFFRNKAKSIRGAAQRLVERHAGEVPRALEPLVELPGVARKTANVVLGTAYGVASGFVVDTHVSRVAARLGLTAETDPVRIESDLSGLFPRAQWVALGHRFVLHGRYTCLARTPLCARCPLNELCPSRLGPADGTWEERAGEEAQRVASGFAASAPATASASASASAGASAGASSASTV